MAVIAAGCGSATDAAIPTPATTPADAGTLAPAPREDAGSSPSILLKGSETLTFDVSAGRNGVPGCPAAAGAVYDHKVGIDLGSRAATLTVETVDCTTAFDANADLPTRSKTTSATATPAQISALTEAVRALSVQPVSGCGAEDGDLQFLTVDRGGGQRDVFGDDGGAHCPPVIGITSASSLGEVFALADALF